MGLLIAVVCFALIYIAQGRIYKRWWNKGLSVDIRFENEMMETGKKSYVIETINNAKRLPLTVLHVKFSTSRSFYFADSENSQVTDLYHRNDVFSIMGNRQIIRKLEFTARERGLYFISGVNVIVKDFFMSKTFADSMKNSSYIYVFPKKIQNEGLDIIFNSLFGDILINMSLFDDPFTYKGIREYTSLDGMKSINWKASARFDNMMVNMLDHTSEQKVKIMLCLEPHVMIKTEYMEELCISIASSAASYFIDKGISVMVSSNGTDILSKEIEKVDYGFSKEHMQVIDKYLARISKNAGFDSFLQIIDETVYAKDINTFYIVISSYHKEDLMVKLDEMRYQGMNVHMIAPYLNIRGFDNGRPYVHGMEVAIDEI